MVAKHLNKLRWLSLTTVFLLLVFIPFASIYQNYQAAHGYDLLNSSEKFLFDVMQLLTDPLVTDASELDALKGTTWSANIFNWKVSDPLAIVSQLATTKNPNLPFILTALVPVVISVLLGRVFCGWVCPASFLYELNTNLALLVNKLGVPVHRWHLDRRFKYYILVGCLLLALLFSVNVLAAIYPPLIVGREIYYAIALDGFSSTAIFFLITMVFDTLISRRGFCRYLCPGGALYSLLGRYRLLRIQRNVHTCNDCNRCNSICEFELHPMQDEFGQECNNCTACVSICPTDALYLTIKSSDGNRQGPGHQGRQFRSTPLIASDCL